MYPVIHLHAAAPVKPAEGEPCNGCGVCCASEPCPVGVLVSGKRTGACKALVWVDIEQRHRCGLIHEPAAHLPPRLRRFAPTLARLAPRYIAAGIGCDCSDEAEPAPIDLADSYFAQAPPPGAVR